MNLVVGATGTVGGRIATELARKGEPVRAMVRSESPGREQGPHTPVSALESAGIEIVTGDLTDPATLPPALEGVRRVLCTASTAKREVDFQGTDVEGVQALVDAAVGAGVEQFVFVSALGASPDAAGDLLRGKWLVEEHLRKSGLPWTILQPVLFMEDWIGGLLGLQLQVPGPVVILGGTDRRFSYVASSDVADLAVAAVGRPEALERELPLSAGPVSYGEILDAVARATGSEPEVVVKPPGSMVPGLPDVLVDLWSGLLMGPNQDVSTPEVAEEFDLELTSVESWIQVAFGRGG
jgi:uncharacterized protein YbjT (DUF2867 family)